MSNLAEVKQTILHMMTLKYDMMCDNKKIIQANPEFLTMARMLINEKQPDCPIIGVRSLMKLQVFDKEVYQLTDASVLDMSTVGQKKSERVVSLM